MHESRVFLLHLHRCNVQVAVRRTSQNDTSKTQLAKSGHTTQLKLYSVSQKK